jgi:spoIIIJ-associated protein
MDEIEPYLVQLLGAANLELKPVIHTERDALVVELSGPDSDLLLDHAGEALDALQVIIGKILPRRFGTTLRVLVDSNNYKIGREHEIIEIAVRTAETVRKSGQAYELSPMSAHERRMVHLALKDDESVTTSSTGEGDFKRVRILPNQEETK